ncbi:MAG: permease-like cell division protein FtsX [Xanthomonadaceae bacterium]|nr:permease-like cell division protein FtsX [Xanthomonadaceae bacterium]MDE1960527.1 permease-like cell division protein FtsX [Xanthomonadaceae bacterium]MDE2084703.1 permease-like cell division protein FtsX [Xanthomonadaceae bacterium]MDE2256279.1 permease-like cell division protein FtsX [Xanthomonadaceae bacterium]
MNRRIEKNRPKPAAPEPRGNFSLRAWREQHLYSLFSSLGRLAARPWATALTLAVLGFALALPLLFWLLLDNARGLAGNVGEAGAISAFLKPGTDVTAVQAFAARLRARADVAAVTVKTPEQGLDEFRERSGFADALKVLHYNPLPAVLIVDPRGDPGPLAAQLRADPAVDQVQYDAQWRQRLNAILVLALRGAQVLAGLLALAALLVIGNTVRQDIAGRSEEIAVMQLLGAEAGFVRRPFLYSGFWYGTFAGVLSLMLIGIVQVILAAPLARLTAAYDHAFAAHGLGIAQMLAVLAASAALGWLGAFLAASRHIVLGQPR